MVLIFGFWTFGQTVSVVATVTIATTVATVYQRYVIACTAARKVKTLILGSYSYAKESKSFSLASF